jgi:hypothetical protein
MAVTPTIQHNVSKTKLFKKVLEKLGARNVNELKDKIFVASNVPDTDSGTNYHFTYDLANDDLYFHTTSTTYTKLNA